MNKKKRTNSTKHGQLHTCCFIVTQFNNSALTVGAKRKRVVASVLVIVHLFNSNLHYSRILSAWPIELNVCSFVGRIWLMLHAMLIKKHESNWQFRFLFVVFFSNQSSRPKNWFDDDDDDDNEYVISFHSNKDFI